VEHLVARIIQAFGTLLEMPDIFARVRQLWARCCELSTSWRPNLWGFAV